MKFLDETLRKRMLIPLIIILLIITAFIADSPKEIAYGYAEILKSKSILLTDYLEVGGIGATLLNVASILLLNYIIIRVMQLRISGPIFAGLLLIVGFSFFGKNIINTLPIYLGIFLFGAINKISQKTLILSYLFSTGISPIVSYCTFGFGIPLYQGIILGTIVGVLVGFIIPSFTMHTIKFSQGYNLLNTGFSLGIIAMIVNAILKTFQIEIIPNAILSTKYHNFLLGFIITLSVLYIISAFILDRKVLFKYKDILHKSGRLITDFIRDAGTATTHLNVGVIGLFCVILVLVFRIPLNGPTVGAIISFMGFGAYGAHLRNSIPVMIGVLVVIFAAGFDFTEPKYVITLFFVFGLAPISGRYGVIAGIISGALCTFVMSVTGDFQGGFCLYNTGFTAGFVASIVIPFIESFRED